jgi:hypothetical protein
MQYIIWSGLVKNEEVIHRVKEEKNILHTIKRKKDSCISHILRRNCHPQLVIEGKIVGRIKVTER